MRVNIFKFSMRDQGSPSCTTKADMLREHSLNDSKAGSTLIHTCFGALTFLRLSKLAEAGEYLKCPVDTQRIIPSSTLYVLRD